MPNERLLSRKRITCSISPGNVPSTAIWGESYVEGDDRQYGPAADAVEKEIELRIDYRDHPEDIANAVTSFAFWSIKANRAAEVLPKIAAFRQRLKPQSVFAGAAFIVAEASCYAALKDAHGFNICYDQLKNVPLPGKWRKTLEEDRHDLGLMKN